MKWSAMVWWRVERKKAPLLIVTILLMCSLGTPGFSHDHAQQAARGSCAALPFVQNATYVGTDTCKACHQEKYEQIAATSHWQKMLASRAGRVGCESCHGPGSAHVEGGGERQKIFNFPPGSAIFCNPCQSCHDANSLFSSSAPVPGRTLRWH